MIHCQYRQVTKIIFHLLILIIFDPNNASFTISSLTAGGTIKFIGKTVSSDEKFAFNELKNALDKISFVGEEGQTSGSALITITDVDRGNSGNRPKI